MELRHLRYFLAVAEECNFTRAASKLGIGQPPLSQQIKQLEREMGVELFRRTAHGVVLTEAGEAFRIEARTVIDNAHTAVRAAQRAARGETGHLRLGFTGSAAFNPIVPSLIRAFRDRYVRVELTLEEANTTQLLEGLEQRRLDAAFIRPAENLPEGLRVTRVADEAMKVVVPSRHPLAQSRRVTMAALAGEPFVIVPRAAGSTLFDDVYHACRRAGFEPKVGQLAPQMSSMVNLVAAELGIAIVPAAITQVKVHGVRYLDITGDAPRARLGLATRVDETSIVVTNLLKLLG
ncbi:LysR family transcriptional regulator [Pararobbsia silviterrae]|uniref:LysR family transcriptional regulator n=1 Tax=Pararobbsia silviterrae TaxID=1792498 RepID=A0A494XSR6_9BURK|nr:LysR family transcriptional regulator [Pararobbsia silviterrae]RKP51916.1 LysR family transcriptional regulator [Pararobbsia silviterrae]